MACSEECNRQLQGLQVRLDKAENDIANQFMATVGLVNTLALTVPTFAVSALGSALTQAFQPIIIIPEMIKDFVDNLLPLKSGDIQKFSIVISMIKSELTDLVKKQIEAAMAFFMKIFSGLVDMLTSAIKQALAFIQNAIQSIINQIASIVNEMMEFVKGIVDAALEAVQGALSTAAAVINALMKMFNGVMALLTSQHHVARCKTNSAGFNQSPI